MTTGFVLGASRLNEAGLGPAATVNALTRGEPTEKSRADALLSTTAQCQGAGPLTSDGRMASRARQYGVAVFSPADVDAWLDLHPGL